MQKSFRIWQPYVKINILEWLLDWLRKQQEKKKNPLVIRHLSEKASLAEIQVPYINLNSHYSNFLYCCSQEIQQYK